MFRGRLREVILTVVVFFFFVSFAFAEGKAKIKRIVESKGKLSANTVLKNIRPATLAKLYIKDADLPKLRIVRVDFISIG